MSGGGNVKNKFGDTRFTIYDNVDRTKQLVFEVDAISTGTTRTIFMPDADVYLGGSGDVVGPASSTDNALTRFDGASGKLLQNSSATLDDAGAMATASLSLTTALPETSGGTGQATYTTGEILYASSSNTLSKLSVGSNGQVLTLSAGVPVWAASAGGVTSVTGTTNFITSSGGATPVINVDTAFEETGMHGWNGSLLESASVTVTSDGATITCSVELSGGGDLTAVFSDGYYAWDTTPADTVTLTAGSDTSPQINYVYFLQSTKTLTASTSSFPAAEHAAIATVYCQSAASLQTDGAYKVHAWTDHVIRSDDQGHIPDINAWIRNQNATWIDGVAQTYTITPNGGAADNVILTTASGNVLQLHSHVFPAFAGTPDVYVVNDSGTPYTKVTDLNALLTDSTGATMSGKYFSLVIWGCVSEATADCKLFCNLPSGSYNSSSTLQADGSEYSNFSIPSEFKGTGFLISNWLLRHQAASSGTWTSIDEIDLRSFLPNQQAGGATAAGSEFVDSTFRILDDADNTKEIAFEASGITTATTRTITMADQAVSLVPNTGTYAAAAGGSQIVTLGTITTGVWTGTDIAVADGGSGRSTATAYAVICGGTTSTAAHQSIASVGTSGQVLTSNGAGALPTFQAASGGGLTWNEETGTSATMSVNNGYIANNAGLVTLTLPTTAAVGDIVEVVGKGAGGWKIAQNASEDISFVDSTTTSGTGGSIASTSQYDSVTLVCITANTSWVIKASTGNLTIV